MIILPITRKLPPKSDEKKEILIHIGGYYASKEPAVIHTLLGSCVAVCLFDRPSGIGGMNHILLPGNADLSHFDASARYGINAMELLINAIMTSGGKRNNLKAKVFGGANLLPNIAREHRMGDKNSAFVMEFLKRESIAVAGKDIGGRLSRRVYFHTDTGEVFLKRIHSIYNKNIAVREEKTLSRIREEAEKESEFTLF